MKLMDTRDMESRFGLAVVQCNRAIAPTGEPFVQLHAAKLGATEAETDAAARKAFEDYAIDRSGMLYWRIKPEIRGPEDMVEPDLWSFYMRLLISDKPVITGEFHG